MSFDPRAYARQMAGQYGLDPEIFVKMLFAESRFNPNVKPSVVRGKDYVGYGQLGAAAAQDVGITDRFDPKQNIEGSARYLKMQLDEFGSYPLALAAYNAGPQTVRDKGGIPNYPETQAYIEKIMGNNSAPSNSSYSSADIGKHMKPADPNAPYYFAGGSAQARPLDAIGLRGSPNVGAPTSRQRSGVGAGLLDYLFNRNPATGLNPIQNFAAALDPLILPDARMGQAIREQGLRQAAFDKSEKDKNQTEEFFKKQKGGEVFLQAIKMGVSPTDVFAAWFKTQQGDYVVVGDSLVDRKTGKVIFQDPSSGSGSAVEVMPDGTVRINPDKMKLSDGQKKSMIYSGRMKQAQDVINSVERAGTSLYDSLVNNIPLAGNYLTSPEYKVYSQAKTNFINAVLRDESGAAIGQSEFDAAERQYFPQAGDTDAVIEQKRQNRELAIRLMSAAAGMGGSYAKQQLDEMYKQATGKDVPANRSWSNEENWSVSTSKSTETF